VAQAGTEGARGPGPLRLLGGFLAVAGTAFGTRFLPAEWRDPAVAAAMLALPMLLWPDRAGLFRPEPRRALRSALEGLAAAAVLLPVFFVGVRLFWRFNNPVPEAGGAGLARAALFQLAMVAVPEEFFFRAFLQRGLEGLAVRKVRLAGARVGWGFPAAAALFALAHLAVRPHPAALLRFFPGLAMGWLWARRESLAGPVVLHTACNLAALWVAPGLL
jgi:membrane protease YdiL (CAAX protease family)